MMKNLITTLVLIYLLNMMVYGQSVSFDGLVDLYELGKGITIDDSSAAQYFDFTPNEQYRKIETGEILIRNDDFVALTAITGCGAGGYCEQSSISIFSNDGILIDRAAYEHAFGDCVFSIERENIYTSDTLLIFTELDFEIEECASDEETIVKNELQLEYVFIVNGKFQQPIIRKVDTRRKYYEGSTKFLKASDLKEYSTEQLAAMRNEIFASHGYTFDTPKWQEYFSRQPWYKPIDKNIDQYLSMIERHNIQTLLKAEKK